MDNTDALQQAFAAEDSRRRYKYEFVTDYSDYETISDPLQKVGKTSMIGLIGALGACALIILLAMAIIIGGRTRELGVLKAIGATDRQVIAQYAVEVICICLVADDPGHGGHRPHQPEDGKLAAVRERSDATSADEEGGRLRVHAA